MDQLLKILTLLFFVAWRAYWWVTEQKADKEKPKTKPTPIFFSREHLSRYGLWLFGVLFVLQAFFGIALFPLPYHPATIVIGFVLVILGFGLCVVARRELSTNWANAWEYQIKQKHELVTSGVYAYIRHPIYTGIIIAVIGSELVANSSLFILFILCFWGAYRQAKKEEKILEAHFGKLYTAYKKRTKMLIPFIF